MGFRVSGLGVKGSGFEVRGSGWGSGFGIRDSGFGVRSSGFGVRGSGSQMVNSHTVGFADQVMVFVALSRNCAVRRYLICI